MTEKKRCRWVTSDSLYVAYHDLEWGRPVHDERRLFEMLILEGAQAGLSWLTILRKREHYRQAFDHFNAAKIARYDRRKVRALLENEGIVRNRLKIEAAISNARAVLRLNDEGSGLDRLLWQFVGGKPVRGNWRSFKECPATTPASDAMSRELKARGFTFVGSTICYAFMQAVGLVDDHEISCFRHRK